MSAELNVKLVLDVADVKRQLADIQSKIGGTLSKPVSSLQSQPQMKEHINKTIDAQKKQTISLADAAKGMLRSLIMYRLISEAMTQLRNVIMAVVNAFQQAKKLYVQGALSGFGTKIQTQRSVVAQVLGISEQDVLRFGNAYKYVNSQLKSSIDLISKNARSLAETNMQWEMMRVKLQALSSVVAIQVSPAIKDFTFIFGKLADFIINRAEQINKWAQKASFVSGMISSPFLTMAKTGIRAWRESEESKPENKMKELFPQMKQLGASAWEKMGLVIGGGGGTNYAKDTANNTKRTNNLLETISRHLATQQNGRDVFQSQPALP